MRLLVLVETDCSSKIPCVKDSLDGTSHTANCFSEAYAFLEELKANPAKYDLVVTGAVITWRYPKRQAEEDQALFPERYAGG